MKVKVGTRGSKLALAQTDWVINELKKVAPEVEFEKVIIKTTGDKILDSPLSKIGGKGLFVKEIEEALLKEEIDLAVHSMKDVPAKLPEGLEIACVPKRESPFDVWISKSGEDLFSLPSGAKVGTSSLRRSVQIKKLRRDLEILPLRGNVDTRLRKLREGMYDAIILAEAGIKRLGLSLDYTVFSVEEMIPSVGQGALGIEIREKDTRIKELISKIHCDKTYTCVKAERAFLHRLEGGCQVPLGAHAVLTNYKLRIVGFVSDLEAERFFKAEVEAEPEKAEEVGIRLAEILLSQGAKEVLEEILGQGV